MHSILLIEDNEDDYEAIERGFKSTQLGKPLKWYNDSKKAIDFLTDINNREERPSIIILDLNMPGLDGKRVLEILKASPELRTIPVVILSTSTSKTDIHHCYAKGASSYMQKPVKFSRMKELCSYVYNYWFEGAVLDKEFVLN